MMRRMLKSKIQEIKITHREFHYAGSLAIDMDIYDAANIRCGEAIHVYNMNNGERFETYAIPAKRGSGIVSVKGAACRRVEKGDVLLVISFADYTEEELENYIHKIVYINKDNRLDHVEERKEQDYFEDK